MAKLPTNPKIVVFAEYHAYLDVFSKDVSDALRLYGKYDHKIEFLNNVKPGKLEHSALQRMSAPQFKFVKKFFKEHIKKSFIEASNAFYSSPILLVKKPGRGIKFCVDY